MSEIDRDMLWEQYQEVLEMTRRHSFSARIRKYRDLSILRLLGEISVVVACDSNASNGEKPNDTHQNSIQEMAVSALKVPTMEVLATGATPIVIADNLCVEMEPTGKKIIQAMRLELERCGLLGSVQLTGSTEDNMLTTQSGVGVTVIGLASEDALKLGHTQPEDLVCCVGIPQSGVIERYSESGPTVAKISTVVRLRELEYVHEILPVGSKGVAYEARELASCVGRRFQPVEEPAVDLLTSAGSCTAVLVSLREEHWERLRADVAEPCSVVGRVV